jgi:hypothetical protein
MKKININPYKIKVGEVAKNGMPVFNADGSYKIIEKDYDLKDVMINLLTNSNLNAELKHGGREALLSNKLANKIEDTAGDELLLEDSEYVRLLEYVDVFKGFGKNDGKFLSRVYDAENVKVEVKKDA